MFVLYLLTDRRFAQAGQKYERPAHCRVASLLKARRKAERELRDRLARCSRVQQHVELTATTERYQSSERQHEAVTARSDLCRSF